MPDPRILHTEPSERLQSRLRDTLREVEQLKSLPSAVAGSGPPTLTPAEATHYVDKLTSAAWLFVGGAWHCISGVSGTVAIPWPGGSGWSNQITITHGLGYIPRTIQLTPQIASGQGGLDPVISDTGPDTTTFRVYVGILDGTLPAAGNHGTLWWWAN